MYDVLIIGGGPAGCAAAVYTARKQLKTLLVTESFGGQSFVSADIQNWIGESHVSGLELAKKLEAHVRAHEAVVEIKTEEKVTKVQAIDCRDASRPCDFEIKTEKGNAYQGKAVIVCAGARRKKLNVPGEAQFDGKGVAYCSTCDAPLFSGKDVAVAGGGNAGLEAAVDLFPYARKIYVLEYGDALKGDMVTQEQVKKNEKVRIILNAQVKEIKGEAFVTGLKYADRPTGEEQELAVQGVFVEIGSTPNSEIVRGLVELDQYNQIKIDSRHGTTSHPGVFAAGDITDDPYKQNNISAGDAVKAALAAYAYLLKHERKDSAGKERNP